MYEHFINVPKIVGSSNRKLEISPGLKIDDLVSVFDIGPTILEWACCDFTDHFSAESLCPFLDDDNETWKGRAQVISEQVRDGNFTTADYQTMI